MNTDVKLNIGVWCSNATQGAILGLMEAVQAAVMPENMSFAKGPDGLVPPEALEDEDHEWWDSEEACELQDELEELLQPHVPAYTYVGSYGDDYGVFPDWCVINEDIHSGDLVQVDAGDQGPEGRAYLSVNDHGNTTLYDAAGRMVWDVV